MEDYKMPIELKQKWITALTDGSHEQCKGRLHNDKGYCCLGVLSSICGVEDEVLDNYSVIEENAAVEDIPIWLTGPAKEGTIINELISRNDGLGDYKQWSFTEIAEWINTHL